MVTSMALTSFCRYKVNLITRRQAVGQEVDQEDFTGVMHEGWIVENFKAINSVGSRPSQPSGFRSNTAINVV